MKPRMSISLLVLRRLFSPSFLGLAMLLFVMNFMALNRPMVAQAAPNRLPHQQEGVFTLTLLHTNDMRGHLDQFQPNGMACASATSTNCIAGVSRLMTKINEYRAATSNTLLLDAGNQFQGTLFYYQSRADGVVNTMNAMGYQAMTIGNHEFDDKSPMLEKLIDGVNFPVLSANIYNPNLTPPSKIKASTVVMVNGQAVGIVGVTTPNTANTSNSEDNVVFSNTVTTLQAEVDRLSAEGINKIIALTHLGYAEDQTLARAIRGVDVIVGGHSQSFLYTLVGTNTVHPESSERPEGSYPTKVTDLDGNEVLIVTAGSWGRYLGRLDVGFDAAGKVVKSAGEPIYIKSNFVKEPTVEAVVATYREPVDALRNTNIGSSLVNMPNLVVGTQICRLGECLLGNLVADAMLWQANQITPDAPYQIAFQNGGSLRETINIGDITVDEALKVLPFGNTLAVLELTGAQLTSALENGVSTFGSSSTTLNSRFPQVSGLRFAFDTNKPAGSRVISVTVLSGDKYVTLDRNASYKIVTNNVMRVGGEGYTMFRDALNTYDFGLSLDQALIDYIKQLPNATVSRGLEGRIIVQINTSTIPAIQGLTNTSPISGQTVMVEGTVVADFQNGTQLGGFFMQAFPGDGNLATSDGIFVNSALVDVAVGDLVQVTGTVEESNGLTRLSLVSAINKLSSGNAVTPVDISFPVTSTTALEMYEGMLVRIPQTMQVTEHSLLGSSGEVTLATARQMIPTNVVTPGAAALALQAANDVSRIVLDDGSNVRYPAIIPYPAPGLSMANTLRGGDTVANVTGALGQGGTTYRLQPSITPTFTAANPRPSRSVNITGSLKVADLTAMNYFVTLGTRGAKDEQELQRQRDKLVSTIIGTGADIVALMEVESNVSNTAVLDLVDSLNKEEGQEIYSAVKDPAGGLRDIIKVAMVYKRAKVTPVGVSKTVITDVFATNSRPPLAQTFKVNDTGAVLTVVANHFKSKNSCPAATDPNGDKGDGQGCWNADRVQSAKFLADWLATDPTGSNDLDFLIVGNLNAYAMEDPLTTLKNKGYVNLVQSKLGNNTYTYVLNGQWGDFDHALASKNLANQVTSVAQWHINADEPPVLDYNIEAKSTAQQASLYAPSAYRSADHDPIIIGFHLRQSIYIPVVIRK